MRLAGIITEYDPFHAGHAWQLRLSLIHILAGFLAFSGWQQSRQLFGARLAGQSQIERITQTTALTADECALYWNCLLYTSDMPQKRLNETLDGVVEDCVNSVGVDLNLSLIHI